MSGLELIPAMSNLVTSVMGRTEKKGFASAVPWSLGFAYSIIANVDLNRLEHCSFLSLQINSMYLIPTTNVSA